MGASQPEGVKRLRKENTPNTLSTLIHTCTKRRISARRREPTEDRHSQNFSVHKTKRRQGKKHSWAKVWKK